jgi:hypothetical protein
MISERTSRDIVAGAPGRPSQHRDRTCNRRFRFRVGSGRVWARAAGARSGHERKGFDSRGALALLRACGTLSRNHRASAQS